MRRTLRLTFRRHNAGESGALAEQREFAGALSLVVREAEVHALLVRRVLRLLPRASEVVVLSAAEGRLKPDCLAVRFGRPHEQAASHEPLLACDLCRGAGPYVACVPAIAAGSVLGAVRVSTAVALDARQLASVAGSVEQAAPVLASLRTVASAERRAQTDALTGLPNRRHGVDTLRRMTAQALRTAAPLGAVMVDVDDFERLDDVLGKEVGEASLAAVAETVRARLRVSDFASRWAGAEFLLLLPDTNREGASRVAEEIRAAITRLRVGDRHVGLTASLGVAEFPTDAVDAAGFVRVVGHAVAAAREAGRNCVIVAPPPDATELLS